MVRCWVWSTGGLGEKRQPARVDGAGCECRGGVAALGGQGAGTEKGGEEAVQQGERKEV